MPGNRAEDRIHEADNSFQGHYLSQTVDDNWSLLNYNEQVGQQRQIGVSLNPSLKNNEGQRLDSIRGQSYKSLYAPFDHTQLSHRSDCSRGRYSNFESNSDGFSLEGQEFARRQNQPQLLNENTLLNRHSLTSKSSLVLQSLSEYESLDSPTLTTNSERSEITETSSDFNFHSTHQQLTRGQHLVTLQPHAMQQPGYNDMQLLQQHMMLKQLQELQRQQHLQQFGDMRQQNSLNQLSAAAKQAGAQFSPFINGTPVHEGQQMFMNWGQQGASPTAQGASNRGVFSQEQQTLALRSTGLVTPQLDASFYGTPVGNARGNMSQSTHLQGISNDTINLLTKVGSQTPKSPMQSSGFSNPFMRDQSAVSANQVCISQGAITSNQGFQWKNMSGQVPFQGFNNGIMTNNFQEGNQRMTTSLKDVNGRQDQTAWPIMQQKTAQGGSPQGLVPLDPMEEKILYNMDDNIWDFSFGSRSDLGTGGVSNALECSDLSNGFPSLQSGSWSALMQSAVAEASSTDTGMQEQWTHLSFQNMEQSTDNQMSNFVESDKKPTGWVDSNSQNAHLFNDSSMNSTFSGFQQPGIQPSVDHTKGLQQDGSHESIQKSPKDTGLWIDGNVEQKPPNEESQQSRTFINMDNAWTSQICGLSESDAQQQRLASYYKGDANERTCKGSDTDAPAWKADGGYGEQVHGTLHMEHSQMKKSAGLPNFNAAKAHRSTGDYMEQDETTIGPKVKESPGYNQHQINDGAHGFCNAYKGAQEVYEKKQNLDKDDFSGFQGTSGELPYQSDVRSVGSDGSTVATRTSDKILELFGTVDQPGEDGSVSHFGSSDSNRMSNMPRVDTHTSATQLYNQSSASQGFNLGLSLPSQQSPNQFLTSCGLPQTLGYPNARQVHSELREKNQTWVPPTSSVQSLSSLPELSQRAIWDNTAALGQAGVSSYMNMPTLPHVKNQSQMQLMSNVPVASQNARATLPVVASRFSPFCIASSQETSREISTGPLADQYPVFEATPSSLPSLPSDMPQQGEFLSNPQNVWVNAQTQQHPSVTGPLNVPFNLASSVVPPNIDLTNCLAYQSSDIGACSMNSLGFNSGAQHQGKVNSQQQISSQIPDSSQGQEYLGRRSSEGNALSTGSLGSHTDQQYQERDLDGVGHSSKALHHQNYSLPPQVQAMEKGLNPASDLNSITSGDASRLGFSPKSSLQPPHQNVASSGMSACGQNDFLSQTCGGNVVSGHTEHGQVNLPMAPSWFKQYGTFKNGQMLPTYEARMATAQFSLGKLSQNFSVHSSVDHGDVAYPSQTGAGMLTSKQLSAPYVLPLDVVNQGDFVMRPKKRKTTTSELLPWHKEVSQACHRLKNISMAEQDWAQATNRRVEKVDESEVLDDLPPLARSKRRIILSTKLMQLLFHPAPAFISTDAASHYEGLSYFVSRLALGDACSLTYGTTNELALPLDNSKVVSEKLRRGNQHISEIVKGLNGKVKELENEFQRLDKSASILDIRVGCQELERFSVINRFAKFHSRGPADTSGTSIGAPKPYPQRYVTAFPMPRNIPERQQCFSL